MQWSRTREVCLGSRNPLFFAISDPTGIYLFFFSYLRRREEHRNMVPRGHRNWIEVRHIAQATVAKFTTSTIVDEEKILVIGRELLNLVQQAGRRPLILNFGGVERISTEMLGNILALQNRSRNRGGQLILCNLNSHLAEAFAMVNSDKSITICGDEKEALLAV
jgi:anti-sigma B factor antagonist